MWLNMYDIQYMYFTYFGHKRLHYLRDTNIEKSVILIWVLKVIQGQRSILDLYGLENDI